jgi:hypothetical protein
MSDSVAVTLLPQNTLYCINTNCISYKVQLHIQIIGRFMINLHLPTLQNT